MKGEENLQFFTVRHGEALGDLRIDVSFPSYIIFYKRLEDTLATFVCRPRIGLRLRLAAPFG